MKLLRTLCISKGTLAIRNICWFLSSLRLLGNSFSNSPMKYNMNLLKWERSVMPLGRPGWNRKGCEIKNKDKIEQVFRVWDSLWLDHSCFWVSVFQFKWITELKKYIYIPKSDASCVSLEIVNESAWCSGWALPVKLKWWGSRSVFSTQAGGPVSSSFNSPNLSFLSWEKRCIFFFFPHSVMMSINWMDALPKQWMMTRV